MAFSTIIRRSEHRMRSVVGSFWNSCASTATPRPTRGDSSKRWTASLASYASCILQFMLSAVPRSPTRSRTPLFPIPAFAASRQLSKQCAGRRSNANGLPSYWMRFTTGTGPHPRGMHKGNPRQRRSSMVSLMPFANTSISGWRGSLRALANGLSRVSSWHRLSPRRANGRRA